MMQTNLNWGRLYAEGNCKAPGIPWTDAERQAVYFGGIPADYVRRGVLNKEDYAKALAEDQANPDELARQTKDDLVKMAKDNGIPATDAATKEDLTRLIKDKRKKK